MAAVSKPKPVALSYWDVATVVASNKCEDGIYSVTDGPCPSAKLVGQFWSRVAVCSHMTAAAFLIMAPSRVSHYLLGSCLLHCDGFGDACV